jgi:hypothetical protein
VAHPYIYHVLQKFGFIGNIRNVCRSAQGLGTQICQRSTAGRAPTRPTVSTHH